MARTVWMTSTDLINAIQLKIAMPISQNTFTNNDLLNFINYEMDETQVPQVLSYHSEYFTHYTVIPLSQNINRYPIPYRAIGQKIRDIFWMDTNGNLYEMTQVDEEGRAFFQGDTGITVPIEKYYFEGNDIVLPGSITSNPAGSLVVVYYIKPNQLVKNDRAATITGFQQTITITNSLIKALDTVAFGTTSTAFTESGTIPFTAVNSLGGTITAITSSGTQALVTCNGHQLSSNQTITISSSNSVPNIDGTWTVSVQDANTFLINKAISTAGTNGTFTCSNQFQIGATDSATATNLAAAINSVSNADFLSCTAATNVVTFNFSNIYTSFDTTNPVAFAIPSTTIGVNFASLPATYTDNETNVTEDLFKNNILIDFLQTKPGHKIYLYDVQIPSNGISGTTITFPVNSLQVPSGTVSGNFTNGQVMMFAPLVVGDYICLATESIIPYIPPDFHSGLAERVGARINGAQGDTASLQTSNANIQNLEQRQGTVMANRDDGHVQKVVNRKSPLWFGKTAIRSRGQ